MVIATTEMDDNEHSHHPGAGVTDESSSTGRNNLSSEMAIISLDPIQASAYANVCLFLNWNYDGLK